jgi:hypothetical protein
MSVEDVYLLMLHEPYASSEHPVPINATIVHALTLLHPAVPQPDGSRMYRCLTEFPSRTPGCLVPLSTLTFELDGGLLWPEIADWKCVVDAVVRLARDKACDATGATARGSGIARGRPLHRSERLPPGRKQLDNKHTRASTVHQRTRRLYCQPHGLGSVLAR